jgi:hypothetical protein
MSTFDAIRALGQNMPTPPMGGGGEGAVAPDVGAALGLAPGAGAGSAAQGAGARGGGAAAAAGGSSIGGVQVPSPTEAFFNKGAPAEVMKRKRSTLLGE